MTEEQLAFAIVALRREQMLPGESWWADKVYRGVSEQDAAREMARWLFAAWYASPDHRHVYGFRGGSEVESCPCGAVLA